MKEFFLKTYDNINLALNIYDTGHDSVLILAHGWFMTKDSSPFRSMAEIFSSDLDVISMDFRGHGKSSGFYTFTQKETIDLKTVVDFAKLHYKYIYLMGFSLGAALAVIHSALQKDVDMLILVSPPTDFNKIENKIFKKAAWLPTLKKFELKRWLSIRPSLFALLSKYKIKPIDVVSQINVPTLFLAGELDPTVFSWHTKTLFDNALCVKKFDLFSNCFHAEDLFLMQKNKFVSICKTWINQNCEKI